MLPPGWIVTRELGGLSHNARLGLALFAQLELGLERLADRAFADDAALDLGTGRDLEHRVEQRLLDALLERASTGSAQQRQLCDGVEGCRLEAARDGVQSEDVLVLLRERV